MRLLVPMLLSVCLCLPMSLSVAATTQPANNAATTKAAAVHCRDARGKFIACAKKPAASPHCRDAKGKFIACAK